MSEGVPLEVALAESTMNRKQRRRLGIVAVVASALTTVLSVALGEAGLLGTEFLEAISWIPLALGFGGVVLWYRTI